MKNNIFILAAILALLATACKKENPQNDLAVTPITISASYGISDDAKVSYTESGNDITATWEAGDQLYVVYNNHVNTLTLSAGAGTASATFTGSIVGTPTATSPLFCYVRDANNPSAVTVSPTGEYTYASGTFLAQDGTLASAAKCNLFYGATTYGNGTNISCTFSPNTSMMKLTVSAPAGVLAGATATLTYKSATTDLAKATFTVGANGWNTLYLTVPAGEYTGTQAFVYQSGETNETRTLSATQACFAAGQTYRKSVYFGISVPDGAIDGMFTINARGDKVYFSKGNLQYIGSASTPYWKFAEHQWDYLGNNGQGSTNQNVDRDLFGYGTSGYNNGQNCWQPYSTIENISYYYSGYLTGNADWGYNAISNGGNTVNKGWRSLTNAEWEYIFNTRTTTSNVRYAMGQVNGVKGVILLPDNWDTSILTLNNPNGGGLTSNTITLEEWNNSLKPNGVVFLPAAGYRQNTTVKLAGECGNYYYNDYDHFLRFYNNEFNYGYSQISRCNGHSVRLVCPVN